MSNNWSVAAVDESSYMFDGCENLVGGNGTTYDSSNIYASYAHIDEADNPGYLTYKAEFIPGDVNGDDDISIADVVAVIDIVTGGDSTTPHRYNHQAADVDGAGGITIADAIAIASMIIGQ